MKEYRDLTADPLQDMIAAGPCSEDDLLVWEALISGPADTPYVSDCLVSLANLQEGGIFCAKLQFVSIQMEWH